MNHNRSQLQINIFNQKIIFSNYTAIVVIRFVHFLSNAVCVKVATIIQGCYDILSGTLAESVLLFLCKYYLVDEVSNAAF